MFDENEPEVAGGAEETTPVAPTETPVAEPEVV